jgi:uncharacterized protein (TIGR02466 family)
MVFHNFAPLAVYETELPGFLPDIYRSFDDHKFTTESGQVTGELAGKVLVHQDKRLHNFYRAIGRKTREYLRSFEMDIDSFEVNVTKSWFGICDPGQTFPMHYHSCAHISFIYYVQPTGDPIVFHTENSNQWFGAAFSFTAKQNGLNVRDYVIEPKPESLLLFPGSLEHYTVPVDREHTRISLAGDIVLTLKKHKVGSEAGLLSPRFWKRF